MRARLWLLALFLAPSIIALPPFMLAYSAEIEPGAEVTIKISPGECAQIFGRIYRSGNVVASAEEDDALARVGKMCDFDGIQEKLAAAQKKKDQGVTFSIARAPKKIQRGTLDQLVSWVTPTKEKPMPMEVAAIFRKMRLEWREVLAGRDPYDAKAP